MGPSLFRQLSEHVSRHDTATRPSSSAGWLVSTKDLVGKELAENPYLASLSNTSVENLTTIGNSYRSLSTKDDPISIIAPPSAGLTAKKLLAPKPQGHLISGVDGQVSGLVPPEHEIGIGFLQASGDNVQSPTIGGILFQKKLPSTTNSNTAELAGQSSVNPSKETDGAYGPEKPKEIHYGSQDALTPKEQYYGSQDMVRKGSPYQGKSSTLLDALLQSANGSISNGHLPPDIDPKTGKETPVSPEDGLSYYLTNTRTGTAYRTIIDLLRELNEPKRRNQFPFNVQGINGTVRAGK